MRGQTSLFPKSKETNRLDIRIDRDMKYDAQEKARSEGYTLSYLLKCFIAGYLSGDILAENIVKVASKK